MAYQIWITGILPFWQCSALLWPPSFIFLASDTRPSGLPAIAPCLPALVRQKINRKISSRPTGGGGRMRAEGRRRGAKGGKEGGMFSGMM